MIRLNLLPRKIWTIYCLTSPSGKRYVGQTSMKLYTRLAQHAVDARNKAVCPALHNAIRKYGWENFRRDTLEVQYSQELAHEREMFWIKELRTSEPNLGYNLTLGGEGRAQRFCVRGHDTAAVGRTDHGFCSCCYQDTLAANRERWQTDPEWRAQQLRKQEKYWRRANKKKAKQIQADPQLKKRVRAEWRIWRQNKLKNDPEYREQERERARNKKRRQQERMSVDPEYRARKLATKRAWHARKALDPEWAAKQNQMHRESYAKRRDLTRKKDSLE